MIVLEPLSGKQTSMINYATIEIELRQFSPGPLR